MHFFRLCIPILFLFACSCSTRQLPSTDWEKVIATYENDEFKVNYLELAKLNLALAQTGRLAEDLFKYTQATSLGLIPEWNRTEEVGRISSDIFFAMGNVAYSQRMAFEANVVAEEEYVPEMLIRLVQTNLIYGAWKVAEKYIDILESDGYDCSRYRGLLGSDAAVEADPELGPKRRCVLEEDRIALSEGIEEDLKFILRQNPTHTITAEYLGVMYLLDCNMEAFKAFLDEFYGTVSLPALPRSFAEAACMLSELERNYWKKMGVSKKIYEQYRDFKTRLETGLSEDKYKDTFWYYIMRVNTSL